jgi:hypothetical protein
MWKAEGCYQIDIIVFLNEKWSHYFSPLQGSGSLLETKIIRKGI